MFDLLVKQTVRLNSSVRISKMFGNESSFKIRCHHTSNTFRHCIYYIKCPLDINREASYPIPLLKNTVLKLSIFDYIHILYFCKYQFHFSIKLLLCQLCEHFRLWLGHQVELLCSFLGQYLIVIKLLLLSFQKVRLYPVLQLTGLQSFTSNYSLRAPYSKQLLGLDFMCLGRSEPSITASCILPTNVSASVRHTEIDLNSKNSVFLIQSSDYGIILKNFYNYNKELLVPRFPTFKLLNFK